MAPSNIKMISLRYRGPGRSAIPAFGRESVRPGWHARAVTHWDEAARWWSALGHDADEVIEVRSLAGGASGSAVYEVDAYRTASAEKRTLILKVTAARAVDERTRREMTFYRDLAGRVPVLVPALVASVENSDGIGLLFEQSGIAVDPGDWSSDRWEELATQLGALHSERMAAAASGWSWAEPEHVATAADVAAAAQTWAELGYAQRLASVWARFDDLNAALTKLPICLRHGDWHRGNILLDPLERFVWIDWQEVGFGRGPEDLALMWQRAEFDGLTPPREAMLSAYARSRGIADDVVLRRATIAAELTLLLLAWPPFLAGGAEPARARLLHRLDRLIDAWHQR